MSQELLSVTSLSLLAQLRDDHASSGAWRRFVDRYGRRIYEWCAHRGLQPADAEDVTQEVLVKLARRLGEFEYDPSQTFRGWLRRVTENTIIDFLRARRQKQDTPTSDDCLQILANTEDRQDLTDRLEEAFDLELLDLAIARVRGRVEDRRWRAWEMTAVKRCSGDEVAAALQMPVPTVYSSRYQVQKLISAEVQQLQEESSGYVQQAMFDRDSSL